MSLYESAFRNLLFPTYEGLLRGRRTLAYLRECEDNQWLEREQIEAMQWLRLKRLLTHCWEHVPYYRRCWQEVGASPEDIRTRADFARLPVLTKQAIRENFEELHADSLRREVLYKATGGSTGEPLRFGYSRESYERRIAAMWRAYGWAQARLGRRMLYLWGGMVGDPRRGVLLKECIYHAAFNRKILNCFKLRDANMAEFVEAIASYRPDVIVAYVDPMVRLARWMAEHGQQIQGVRSMLGAAEALHDWQRQLIEAAFPGAQAFNTYGCREFMLIASECEHRTGLHVTADQLVVELQPQPGYSDGTGDVVITDLTNYAMPFVRYANGDLATPEVGVGCACGRGLPRLHRVEGRKLDAIRTPGGHVVPGEFFPHMLKDVAGLQRYRVIQRQLDALQIDIIPDPPFGEEQEAYIRREVAKVFGDTISVELRRVADIPLTPTGKSRVTISELS